MRNRKALCPQGVNLGGLLLWLNGFQKRSTGMDILAKSNILFAHISPSVKVLSATDLARLPEVSAPLSKVDFRLMVFTALGQPPKAPSPQAA